MLKNKFKRKFMINKIAIRRQKEKTIEKENAAAIISLVSNCKS